MEVLRAVPHDYMRVAAALVGPLAGAGHQTFFEERVSATAVAVDGEVTSITGTSEAGCSAGFDRDGRRQLRHVPMAPDRELPAAAWEATRRLAVESSAAGRAVDPRIRDARATARWIEQRVVIVDADGRTAEDVRRYADIDVRATARDGARVRRADRSRFGAELAELLAGDGHVALGREAAAAALERLEAVAAPAGELPVIFAPGWGGVLFHEACGHLLEADLAARPGSAFGGRLGQEIASPLLTLVDDPSLAAGAAPQRFDDEGEPARPTVLVEDGRLAAYLTDRAWARRAGGSSNGHARRLGYAHPVLPRMSNTYVAPGPHGEDEIIRATRRGLLVETVLLGDTDFGSGSFRLRVSEARLVEDGRITAPVRGATLFGRADRVLRDVDMVGASAPRFMALTCGKLGQFPMLVSVGQPAVRVARMAVRP
ncbi:MAG TPA: TldD/PmbA family protein [Candidatus Dormibacteraeota bacterium]